MHDLALIGTELCYWWETAPSRADASDVAPAVYRWVVRDPAAADSVVAVFVGEADALSGEAADADAAERLREHRARGHEVTREVLRFTHFEVGGRRVAPAHLADRSVRLLLSGLFAFLHAQEGLPVLLA